MLPPAPRLRQLPPLLLLGVAVRAHSLVSQPQDECKKTERRLLDQLEARDETIRELSIQKTALQDDAKKMERRLLDQLEARDETIRELSIQKTSLQDDAKKTERRLIDQVEALDETIRKLSIQKTASDGYAGELDEELQDAREEARVCQSQCLETEERLARAQDDAKKLFEQVEARDETIRELEAARDATVREQVVREVHAREAAREVHAREAGTCQSQCPETEERLARAQDDAKAAERRLLDQAEAHATARAEVERTALEQCRVRSACEDLQPAEPGCASESAACLAALAASLWCLLCARSASRGAEGPERGRPDGEPDAAARPRAADGAPPAWPQAGEAPPRSVKVRCADALRGDVSVEVTFDDDPAEGAPTASRGCSGTSTGSWHGSDSSSGAASTGAWLLVDSSDGEDDAVGPRRFTS